MKNTDAKPSEHKDEEALQAARKEPSGEAQKGCKTPRDKAIALWATRVLWRLCQASACS